MAYGRKEMIFIMKKKKILWTALVLLVLAAIIVLAACTANQGQQPVTEQPSASESERPESTIEETENVESEGETVSSEESKTEEKKEEQKTEEKKNSSSSNSNQNPTSGSSGSKETSQPKQEDPPKQDPPADPLKGYKYPYEASRTEVARVTTPGGNVVVIRATPADLYKSTAAPKLISESPIRVLYIEAKNSSGGPTYAGIWGTNIYENYGDPLKLTPTGMMDDGGSVKYYAPAPSSGATISLGVKESETGAYYSYTLTWNGSKFSVSP